MERDDELNNFLTRIGMCLVPCLFLLAMFIAAMFVSIKEKHDGNDETSQHLERCCDDCRGAGDGCGR